MVRMKGRGGAQSIQKGLTHGRIREAGIIGELRGPAESGGSESLRMAATPDRGAEYRS